MTTVKASCPVCGDVEDIPAQAFTVVIERTGCTYSFTCPLCRDLVTRAADLLTCSELVEAGARTPRGEVEAFLRALDRSA